MQDTRLLSPGTSSQLSLTHIHYPQRRSLHNIPWPHMPSEDDFASNAALSSSQAALSVTSHSIRSIDQQRLYDTTQGAPAGKEDEAVISDDGLFTFPGWSAATKRRDLLRVHNDQLSGVLEFISLSTVTPFELPQPTQTPPYRVKSKSSRPSWLTFLLALCTVPARLGRTRILAQPTMYLSLYFTLNLALTLYNKSLLLSFPFPYTLSSIHALCGTIGSLILVRIDSTPVPRLNAHQKLILLAFSGLYTINIIVSNVSLGLVTVPLHQVIRAATPLFTILFSKLVLGKNSSRRKLVALVPVMAGVGFATYGDYYCTLWGFILTLFGTVLASLKTVYTNVLQTPSSYTFPPGQGPSRNASTPPSSKRRLPRLAPLHLLYLLSPLAFMQSFILAQFSGELGRVYETIFPHLTTNVVDHRTPRSQLLLLVLNGVLAFVLNVVSFSTNRNVGPLNMTVAGERF
ncbi:hypothetical protein H0H93_008209 [Arthromyces matolae]|nr:hypothetical protein H0H93_008209 [Arthromyces matolae]